MREVFIRDYISEMGFGGSCLKVLLNVYFPLGTQCIYIGRNSFSHSLSLLYINVPFATEEKSMFKRPFFFSW